MQANSLFFRSPAGRVPIPPPGSLPDTTMLPTDQPLEIDAVTFDTGRFFPGPLDGTYRAEFFTLFHIFFMRVPSAETKIDAVPYWPHEAGFKSRNGHVANRSVVRDGTARTSLLVGDRCEWRASFGTPPHRRRLGTESEHPEGTWHLHP